MSLVYSDAAQTEKLARNISQEWDRWGSDLKSRASEAKFANLIFDETTAEVKVDNSGNCDHGTSTIDSSVNMMHVFVYHLHTTTPSAQ